MIGRDDIAGIAGELPGAYEQASYDQAPSWRTKPRMFAWIRDDPEALVVWVASEEDKLALIAANPAVFFTTAHYDGQPILLVRMPEVDPDEARELIVESWRLRAPKGLVKAWDAEHPSNDRGLGSIPRMCTARTKSTTRVTSATKPPRSSAPT